MCRKGSTLLWMLSSAASTWPKCYNNTVREGHDARCWCCPRPPPPWIPAHTVNQMRIAVTFPFHPLLRTEISHSIMSNVPMKQTTTTTTTITQRHQTQGTSSAVKLTMSPDRIIKSNSRASCTTHSTSCQTQSAGRKRKRGKTKAAANATQERGGGAPLKSARG